MRLQNNFGLFPSANLHKTLSKQAFTGNSDDNLSKKVEDLEKKVKQLDEINTNTSRKLQHYEDDYRNILNKGLMAVNNAAILGVKDISLAKDRAIRDIEQTTDSGKRRLEKVTDNSLSDIRRREGEAASYIRSLR